MSWLAWVGVVWAGAAALFSVLAHVRVVRSRAATARNTPSSSQMSVLLLRPLDAPLAHELACLSAPLESSPTLELEQVVLSPYRPPLPEGVGWLCSDPPTPNRKVGHLVYALSTLDVRGRWVLSVDADVRVDEALVRGLVEPLRRGAALSTAAPEPERSTGLAARAAESLLCRTHQAFRALDALSVGAKAVCGKALGLGPAAQKVLRGLGGHIGEDLELSTQLDAQGAEVALSAKGAKLVLPVGVRWGDVLRRFTRWMQVLRAHRPWLAPSVPLLFAPTWPLAALAVVDRSLPVTVAWGALCGVRTGLAWALSKRAGLRVFDWPLGELLLLWAFLRASVQREVDWRGRSYSLERGGRMVPVWDMASGVQG